MIEGLTTCNYYGYGLPTSFWIGLGIGFFIALILLIITKSEEEAS